MAFEIRRVEKKDLEGLFCLFNKRKGKELLNWLYSHPSEGGRSAYVAVDDDGVIIGAVGYVKSLYALNGKKLNGLIPLSWEVSEKSRGVVGMRLILKALKDADFYLGMDGSDDMKEIFKGMNFKKVGEGVSARKVLKPLKYLKTLSKIGIRDLTRVITNTLRLILSAKKSSLKLIPITDFESGINSFASVHNLLYHPISPDHLLWLSKNPDMDMFAFKVEINNKTYGPIVTYIKTIKSNEKRGQIAHIPPLKSEDEKYYSQLIVALESVLSEKGARAITTFITDDTLKAAFKKLNYRFDKKTRPIVAKSTKDIFEEISSSKVFLSFAESDKSIRNI